MDTVNVSDIKKLLNRVQFDVKIMLHDLDTKVLIGEINRPETQVEKTPRKKRTTKVKVDDFPSPTLNPVDKLLYADHPFYDKPKRGRKKKMLPDENHGPGMDEK